MYPFPQKFLGLASTIVSFLIAQIAGEIVSAGSGSGNILQESYDFVIGM